MSKAPKEIFMNVLDRAVSDMLLFSCKPHSPKGCKPGEWYEKRVKEEEKEVLKNITSDEIKDVIMRWSGFNLSETRKGRMRK